MESLAKFVVENLITVGLTLGVLVTIAVTLIRFTFKKSSIRQSAERDVKSAVVKGSNNSVNIR